MTFGSNKALNISQKREASVSKDLCVQMVYAKCKDLSS